uniref:AN1-type domain-containing protein n=1 Tax=viral metagenome TaxID=1070528 RepID=A0A6C0JUN1_9ZZZZ
MKKRCDFLDCKKVLLLSSITCKCTKTFCSTHRSSYDHSCNYDYKNEHTSTLMKYMSSAVITDKVAGRI